MILSRTHLVFYWSIAMSALLLGLLTKSGNAQTDQSTANTPATPRISDYQRDIEPLFRDKCAKCHQGEKAQNGFVITDRDAVLGWIEPGKSGESSLWNDYLVQPSKSVDKDSMVMPPDGPLSASQLALIKLWIDEGAVWPEAKLEPKAPVVPSSFTRNFYLALGYFHPAMVHFPIVLFSLSGLCAFLSFFIGPKLQSAAYQCLVLAAFTSVITALMGWSFADSQGYPDWHNRLTAASTHDQANFFYHRWCGTMVPVIGMGVAFMAWSARRNSAKRLNQVWRVGAILLAGLIGLVGHQGGELIYGDIFEKAAEQLRK